MNHSLKPLLQVLLAALLLSAVSLVIWIVVNVPNQRIQFGRVVAVTSTTITVANKHDEVAVFLITASTTAVQNKEELAVAAIPVASFVQITSTEESDVPAAVSIRLMGRPNEAAPQHDKN